ncbi:hypothetical protein F4861DRAFT_523995 [Xylaria intraflava]|nr:hypothetical protein F4861DRAFT_523995 [Xylaria intraflava]
MNDPGTIEIFMKIKTAAEYVYVAGVTAPKVCILMLYLRIFVDRKTQPATKIIMAVVLVNWIATGIIGESTICQPFAYKWDKSIPGGHCSNLEAAYRFVSIPNILTDVATLALPVPALYHLQTTRVRKVGFFLTFLAGGL